MRLLTLLSALALAACGADGDPVRPGGDAAVSGEARIGVVGEV
ncbi:MAG: hypothetical protein ABJF50_09955 [Paracoccaceae bacterium]